MSQRVDAGAGVVVVVPVTCCSQSGRGGFAEGIGGGSGGLPREAEAGRSPGGNNTQAHDLYQGIKQWLFEDRLR